MQDNLTFCAQIGHLNTVYCGIKQQWSPRLSTQACLACAVFPAFFSLICTAFGVPLIWRNFNKLNLYENAQEIEKLLDPNRWSRRLPAALQRYKLQFTVYILPLVPLLWDTLDVVLDGVYFYNIEQGGFISPTITRNTNVNNALVAWAALGSLKTPILVLLIGRFWDVIFSFKAPSDFTYKLVALSPSAIGDLYISIIIYLSEDCVELFLEYFWIEKYISDHPSSAVVLKNALSAIFGIIPLVGQIIKLKNRLYIAEQIDNVKQQCTGTGQMIKQDLSPTKSDEEKSQRQRIFICWVGLSIITLMSSIGAFLKACAAMYQLIQHRIPESCLYVTQSGILYQSPLNDKCLRFIDFMILFFNFLPLFIYGLICIFYFLSRLYLIFTLRCFKCKGLFDRPPSGYDLAINRGKAIYNINIIIHDSDSEPQVNIRPRT